MSLCSDELQLFLIIADRAVNDDVLADSLTYKMNLVQERAGIGLCSLRGMFSIPIVPFHDGSDLLATGRF